MFRPKSLPPALSAVVAILVGQVLFGQPALAEVAAPAPAREDAPLAVTIDSLSPSVIPRSGPIRVNGSVTNTDDATWYGINVSAFISDEPLTSMAELDGRGRGRPLRAHRRPDHRPGHLRHLVLPGSG